MRRAQCVAAGHPAFLQLVDSFRQVKREFPVQLTLQAAGTYDVPEPAEPRHYLTHHLAPAGTAPRMTRATPSVSRLQLSCSGASCLRPLAVSEYNRASTFFSGCP